MSPEFTALHLYIAAAANLAGFILMGVDKHLAKANRRRIREAHLLIPVLFGGIAGVLLGMRAFRHKTVKSSFQLKLAAAFSFFALALYLTAFRG